MAASSDSESDWEDVEDAEGVRCPCLFCSRELDTASDVLDHCAKEHGVDILDIRAKRSESRLPTCDLMVISCSLDPKASISTLV